MCVEAYYSIKKCFTQTKKSVLGEPGGFQQPPPICRLPPFPGSFPPTQAAQGLLPEPGRRTRPHCCPVGSGAVAGVAGTALPNRGLRGALPAVTYSAYPKGDAHLLPAPAHPGWGGEMTCRSPAQGKRGVPRNLPDGGTRKHPLQGRCFGVSRLGALKPAHPGVPIQGAHWSGGP